MDMPAAVYGDPLQAEKADQQAVDQQHLVFGTWQYAWRFPGGTHLSSSSLFMQAHFSAPSSERRKLMSAPLSAELKNKHGVSCAAKQPAGRQ